MHPSYHCRKIARVVFLAFYDEPTVCECLMALIPPPPLVPALSYHHVPGQTAHV